MSSNYEWQETKNDKKNAAKGVATLVTSLLGIGITAMGRHRKNQKAEAAANYNARIREQIDRKTDQYNAINAKIFKSSAEKREMERLQSEILELRKQLR